MENLAQSTQEVLDLFGRLKIQTQSVLFRLWKEEERPFDWLELV